MKLLLDQGLPRSAAALLREKQIETVHVGEIDMATASDEEIISYARLQGYSIATLDADFHALIALEGANGPSVIRLRIQRLKAQEAASIISRIVNQLGHELEAGCFLTVTANATRMMRLPIRKGT